LPDITQTKPANLNPSAYNTIIFDLGVVIIDLHPERCVQAFGEITGHPAGQIEEWMALEHPFHPYERGEITTREFISELGRLAGKPLSYSHVYYAWNALLGEIPASRLQLIERISQKHRTFVLSNTNDLHIQEFHALVDKSHGLPYFRSLFEKIYYSYEMEARKPEVSIYQKVLAEQGLDAKKVLFIDDNLDNIQGAKKLGISTLHAPHAESWMNIFYEQGY
jgi:glucose-1-phosphatase